MNRGEANPAGFLMFCYCGSLRNAQILKSNWADRTDPHTKDQTKPLGCLPYGWMGVRGEAGEGVCRQLRHGSTLMPLRAVMSENGAWHTSLGGGGTVLDGCLRSAPGCFSCCHSSYTQAARAANRETHLPIDESGPGFLFLLEDPRD